MFFVVKVVVEVDKSFRTDSLDYFTSYKQIHTNYLSDANMSPLSMFSITSLKASQPSSPRQLPVQSHINVTFTFDIMIFLFDFQVYKNLNEIL